MMNYPPYTLGLDIGMASVGAALLAEDHVLALHVRTFDKAETDKEGSSLNLIRRSSRLTRRRIRRRSFRLLRLVRLFKRLGMIEQATPSAFALPQSISTWQLRGDGLGRLLTATEWAAVLYHIVKHRGFLSNRKSEAKADEKMGQMLSGVNANKQLLLEKSYRTIGEMVAKDESFVDAKRNKGGDYSHTFSRLDLADEVRLLFAQQRLLANPYAGEAVEQQVITLLMARRPALSGKGLLDMLGRCTFEPKEYRAPKASYTAERFVWLTKLNNLRIYDQGTNRALTESERRLIIDLPYTLSKLTYKQVRTKLSLDVEARFVGLRYNNEKDVETTTLFEAKYFQQMKKAYKEADLEDKWQQLSLDAHKLNSIAYAQSVYKDDTEASSYLQQQGFAYEEIEAILTLSFSEFIRLSVKALDKILPHMEVNKRYDEAVVLAGYQHHSMLHQGTEKQKYIPKISKEDIANPVVYRALNQARKLVNAIVKEYGSPKAVHIELARDLNKPFDERRRIEREQKSFQETKQKDIAEFVKLFGQEPRGTDIAKWRLYREQDSKCAYSLHPLDLNRLFEVGYAEIDHALPYSRSFDDSMNNKVLVLTVENRNKGNRTPYEYLNGAADSEEWRLYVANVEGNAKYRLAKRMRLLRKHLTAEDSQEFRERNLTDTRYASKKFKELVETHLQLHAESTAKRCLVVSGQLTSLLRARWGLLKLRENGDLHHALDAAVVAAASHAMVKRMSDYARKKELAFVQSGFVDPETGEIANIDAHNAIQMHFPEPWTGFRAELIARLSPNPAEFYPEGVDSPAAVRVSRAPLRRGYGAAHQETIRSKKILEQQKSYVKTPLTNIKLKDVPNILGYDDPRNAALIAAISERLQAFGDDPVKAFKEPLYRPSKDMRNAPMVRSVKLLSTQKSGIDIRHGIAANGDMLRVDIFVKAGKHFAVPIYVADAVKAELPNKASAQGKDEAEWPEMDESYAFLFSLHKNDWLKVSLKGKVPIAGYFGGLDRATATISIWAHDRHPTVGKSGLIRGIGIKTALKLEKYHVDMLGRLYAVKAEKRQAIRLPKAGKS